MAKTRLKTDAVAVAVPKTDQEAAEYVMTIGAHQRELKMLEAAVDEQKSAFDQKLMSEAAPHKQGIEDCAEGLRIYCEANRKRLTNDGKVKTVDFEHGIVAWRMRPPSVRVASVKAVIDTLRALDFTRFIRVKEEVDKEAILREPETVAHLKGITISQGEDFIIKPNETDLEQVVG
ncbi:MAG: host-nuclease inhibitor Gam family protein [Deltaproteobacteria bacterium]|nr:host-nuclease inhibitor Gam family protein [Deltaproteobacteria bacterium]